MQNLARELHWNNAQSNVYNSTELYLHAAHNAVAEDASIALIAILPDTNFGRNSNCLVITSDSFSAPPTPTGTKSIFREIVHDLHEVK